MIDRESLYRQFHPKVLGYVRTRVAPEDAEDVAADVFVRIYANLDGYDPGRASLSTWIYTITHNAVIDYGRARKNTPLPLEDYAGNLTAEQTNGMDDLLEDLSKALEKLTQVQRDVVILHYYFGLRHQEIAERLHLSPANTRKICSLALAALRKNMSL